MNSGAFVSARHKLTGKAGWAVFTQRGCDSSSMQFALDCAALCAMNRADAGSSDPNDFEFTWGVDCFDCTTESVPNGLLSSQQLRFSSGTLVKEILHTPSSELTCGSTILPVSKTSIKLDDSTQEPTELNLIWSASDGRIGHQRGEAYETNYWIDKTRTNDLWTCYGPYENLPPGRYRATWGITLGVSCPPMVTAHDYWVVEMDVVANVNSRTLWGPKGVTWATACRETGNIAAEFEVPQNVSQVEVRLRKRKWADYLIVKFLLIERV